MHPSSSLPPGLPKIQLFDMFRLGLFQLGLGTMSLLTLGLLNRLMINELNIPPTIAAGLISLPLFMAPARVWFGQLSDSRPIGGLHRSAYVWIGAILFSGCSFLAVQLMWQFGASLFRSGWDGTTLLWGGGLALAFALYGLALSISSTPFAALLVDVSDEAERSKLVGVVWSMLMVGIVIGAITVGGILSDPVGKILESPIGGGALTGNPLDPAITNIFTSPARLAFLQNAVNRIFVLIPAIVVALAFTATWGIEKRFSRFRDRLQGMPNPDREDQITLGRAFRVLTASRQTSLFFVFLICMSLGLFMQDAVMEPYGGEIFGMSIAQTTQLNAPFGLGTLLGISVGGFLIAPRVGKQNTARLGCIAAIVGLIILVLVGWTGKASYLFGVVFVFGLASGVTTTGAVSLMLDLTAAATAGTFIGAWGLAQALARGMATLLGGLALDLGKLIFPIPLLSYGFVFCLQALIMVLAITLLGRVNVREFQETTKRAILQVIASEVD